MPTGGVALNRAIAADFGFTVGQAEDYKKLYGISSQNLEGKLGKSTEPILMSIIGEIQKALAFYNEKYKTEAPIAQIVLSGGSAKLTGLDLFFAEKCGIETVTANPWSVCVDLSQLPQDLLKNGPDYTIAIGLAMRGYE